MTVDPAELARKFSQPLLAHAPQRWATRQVASSHEEALFAYGEYGIFVLMWRASDFAQGLVDRCSVCFNGVRAQQAEAFQQPTKRECPNCYGTTYEGGYRAAIIRPMLVSDKAVVVADQKQGVTETDTVQFETTSDFTFTLGDYVIRADNSRYQCETKAEVAIRTGFEPANSEESLNSTAVAHLEALTSVAYLLPPTDPAPVLDEVGAFHMEDIDALNIVIRTNGYL